MGLMSKAKKSLLLMSSAMLIVGSSAEVTFADLAEPRASRANDRLQPSSSARRNNGGFFNFLDFSERSARRRGNYDFFGSDTPRRQARTSVGKVMFYTYKADALVALRAPDIKLPLPEASATGLPEEGAADGVRKLDDSLAQTVFDALKAGATPVKVTQAQRKAIKAFYEDRGFKSVWTSMDGLEPKAREVLEVLQQAAAEGMDETAYRLPVLAERGSIDAVESDLAALARFDIEMTALALRYSVDASGGVIVPNRLSGYHDLNPPKLAAKTALRRLTQAVVDGGASTSTPLRLR